MNKSLLIGALLAVGGFAAYRYFINPALTGSTGDSPFAGPVNPYLIQQPGTSYPYQAAQPVRNDNKSEPWYGGSRLFNVTPDMSGLQNIAQDLGSVASIGSSLSNLWQDLDIGNWFGGGEDSFSLDNFASNSLDTGFDWSSFDSEFSFDSVV